MLLASHFQLLYLSDCIISQREKSTHLLAIKTSIYTSVTLKTLRWRASHYEH